LDEGTQVDVVMLGLEGLPGGWARLADRIAAGDPDGHVAAAWQLKEITRDLYRAADLDEARFTLHPLYTWAATGPPECRRLAATVRRWEKEILAWHTTGGASNGPTEAVNLLIKKIKRTGHGFRNFDNTGSACCCTAASPGTMPPLRASEDAPHAWWRRARIRDVHDLNRRSHNVA